MNHNLESMDWSNEEHEAEKRREVASGAFGFEGLDIWGFLAYGIKDHLILATWEEVQDHCLVWLVEVLEGDTVHGRLPSDQGGFLALAYFDDITRTAFPLGERRYCCATTLRAAKQDEVDHALRRYEYKMPGYTLEEARPFLKAMGF